MRMVLAVVLSLVLVANSSLAVAANKPTVYAPEVYLKSAPAGSKLGKVKWWVWALLGAGVVGGIAALAAGGGGGGGGGGNGDDEGDVRINVPALPSN
jgi:hypothetical protein